MKKLLIFAAAVPLLFSCGKSDSHDDDEIQPAPQVQVEQPDPDMKEVPLDFKNVVGRWELRYNDNFGYEFRFNRAYKAIVIIYLNAQAFVFKGVYNIEDGKKIRINIFEMKQDLNPGSVNVYSGFDKSNSSYFLMGCKLKEKNKARTLFMRPERVVIDGKSSDGYFEPVMKLKKTG